MQSEFTTLEIYRWGFATIPGIIFTYAKELDLELEDIGLLSALFYTLERTHPLYQTGINAGLILRACPFLTKQKLINRLSRLNRMEIITVKEKGKSFSEREVYLEPLIIRLKEIVVRDHPDLLVQGRQQEEKPDNKADALLEQYRERIIQLELQLEEEKKEQAVPDPALFSNANYKKVADFIAKKTGNLLSVKMASELKKWLEDMAFTPEFLLCMLELCFERNIQNPREITQIARDIKEYSINTVEGLELYFSNYVDQEKNKDWNVNRFDPDIVEFGTFTGIDMSAAARKRVYYKWRYDWRFSHAMIMKAGEIMCQRTKNGGLEYIDSVLNNWMSKEIRQVEDAEKELQNFKSKKKAEKKAEAGAVKPARSPGSSYEIYVPPNRLEQVKSKV